MTTLDIDSLISRMTLEQKASLLSGQDFWHTQAIAELGIPAVMVTDGPHGLRKQAEGADHLGLGNSVPATCFPTACALASSWDPALLRQVGEALGDEALQEQVAVILGPGVNIKRSPLCGRNFEYFSEDPRLAGTLATALVGGIESRGVGTSLKHYAANNQETDRLRVSAEVDERTLREIYLSAFEQVVREAKPATVMCSYNKVNGVYASENHWLLTEVLRGQWGFDGMVVSDWGAVADRVAGVAAGLDLEMPSSGGMGDAAIVAAVKAGELDEAVVDTAVRRVLAMVSAALPALQGAHTYDAAAHHALARQVAGQCVVLLKNDGVLPLDPAGTNVAVIGAFAAQPRYQGAGSSQVNPTQLDNALDEMRALAGAGRITYAPGFSLDHDSPDEALVSGAAAAARQADVAVVFLGLPARIESEGFDREDIELPAGQHAALQAVIASGTPVVVVLSNGGVVSLEPWHGQVGAIVEGWLGGQAGGGGIADVLYGAVNPSGKLPETIPLRLEDNPSYLGFPGSNGTVRYGEGIFVGYRWYDARRMDVRYPFGHGLSYTTFAYADLAVSLGDELSVSFTLTNTGQRAGAEVAQVYVSAPECDVERPVRELAGFAKVYLEPGESRRVDIQVPLRALQYWSEALGDWKQAGGQYVVEVGASSRDLLLQAEVEVPDDGRHAALTASSTIADFLAHPVVGPMIMQGMAEMAGGVGLPMDENTVKMMASMPLDRIAHFPGTPVNPEMVAQLLALANQ